MKLQDIQKLSESITVFSTILGQLEYSLKLYDKYVNQTLQEYYSGRFPHPFTMIAEDSILVLLNCFIEESEVFNSLMQKRVPHKYVAFNRLLKKEHWPKIIRNKLIAHKRRDKTGRFISIQEMYNTFDPNPEAVRHLGEQLKEVLVEIAFYYMKEPWFPELKKLVESEDPSSLICNPRKVK